MKIIVSAVTLAVAVTAGLPQLAHAERVRSPRVPTELQVLPPYRAFLVGHATGSQNYICLPSVTSFAWLLFTPQATLFEDNENQIITHFLSANPIEGGTARASWQHSRDTSTVWAVATDPYTLPDFVAPGAIPWLKLHAVGAQDGPGGGDKLTPTVYLLQVRERRQLERQSLRPGRSVTRWPAAPGNAFLAPPSASPSSSAARLGYA
jgi:hypothetical protein